MTTETSTAGALPRSALVRGLWSQMNVVRALLLRETRTRFGAHQLGYLWALLEPVLFVGTFYILFSVAGRSAPSGMAIVPFLITGIIPYQLYQVTASRAVNAVQANKTLLFYPQVRPLDLVFARSTLEIVTLFAVFAFLMGLYALWEGSLTVSSFLVTWTGLALSGGLGAALGLVLSSASVMTNLVSRLVGPFMRPFFWTSGLFFTGAQMPPGIRNLLSYNPLFNTVELVREGWFPSYHAEGLRMGYVIAWILGLTLVGLALERVARKRIELT